MTDQERESLTATYGADQVRLIEALEKQDVKIAALESRLALYEGRTPDDPEMKEALDWVGNGASLVHDDVVDPRYFEHTAVLARALKAAMAKLKTYKECWMCAGSSDLHGEADVICADCFVKEQRRAESAEAANKELEANLTGLDSHADLLAKSLWDEKVRSCELEDKLEEARKALVYMASSQVRFEIAEEKAKNVLVLIGHPSPLPAPATALEAPKDWMEREEKKLELEAIREKVVEASMDHYRDNTHKCYVCTSACAALDSAEAKERG